MCSWGKKRHSGSFQMSVFSQGDSIFSRMCSPLVLEVYIILFSDYLSDIKLRNTWWGTLIQYTKYAGCAIMTAIPVKFGTAHGRSRPEVGSIILYNMRASPFCNSGYPCIVYNMRAPPFCNSGFPCTVYT